MALSKVIALGTCTVNGGLTVLWLIDGTSVFQRGGRKQHKQVYSCFLLPCLLNQLTRKPQSSKT